MAQLIIDVSEHNGQIDWQQVKDAGYHAIIRCGFGRFDQGGRYDYYWERNVSECERLGIPYGVYWYSYAASTASAQIEANQCVEALRNRKPSYPIYFDTEEPGTQSASRANAEAFCKIIEESGRWAGIYASESWWKDNLAGLEEKYTTWVANWSQQPSIQTDLWQRSGADGCNAESVPGVGLVDMNVLLRESMLDEINGGGEEEETKPSADWTVWFDMSITKAVIGSTVKLTPVSDTKDLSDCKFNYVWVRNGQWINESWGSTLLYTGDYTTDREYEFKFNEVGTYDFYCDAHASDGTVSSASCQIICSDDTVEPQPPTGNVLTYNQRFAEVMHHLCSHDGNSGHGYSQVQRWGDGTFENIILSDKTVVQVPNGDGDCSSKVITACECVLPGSTADATYTGNMKNAFLSTGLWEWHPMGDGYIAQSGDIYLNEVHHTAMCWTAEPDILMQFSLSENNTVHGQQGDQTGYESNIKPYYNYPWDGKLVYVGPQPEGAGGMTPQPPTSEPITPGDPTTVGVQEDGYWGENTTRALQIRYGVVEDGEVWHQWPINIEKNPGLTTGWQCDYTQKGSPVIRALQADLGITTDGLMGSDTIKAIQKRCGTTVDGEFWGNSPAIKEMQHRLNEGTW